MKIKYRIFLLICMFSANLCLLSRAFGATLKLPDAKQAADGQGQESAPKNTAPSPAETLDLSNLAISESIGKIETRRVGKSTRWVVHIQDVHAHFAAQENIAAILDQLNATYGIKTVAVEGSWHSTSLPKSWAVPSSREKQMLARTLLEDHYLTGPGHAALFSLTPLSLIGIEDPKLYEENRKIYLEHISRREEISKKVDAVDQEIAGLKEKLFNPDLRAFDQALLEFRKGKKAEKFLPSLISKTEALGIDISSFDQIVLLKNTLAAEKSLNKEKLKAEGTRLVQAYKSKRLSFEELLRSGKVPAEKLQFYPELQKYTKLIQLQDQIAHRPLFSQLDEVTRRVKEKLIVKEEEKVLDQRSERFELAKKIILFQATPEDLKIFSSVNQAPDNSPSPLPLPLEGGEEKGEGASLGALKIEIQKAGLGEALRLGLNFYEIAKKRDRVFFEKITRNPKLDQNIAVVAGGFHTEGLSQQLEEAGISYLVITPDLAEEIPNEAAYFERLKIGPVQSQTMAAYVWYMDPLSKFDGERFPGGVRIYQTENNLGKAKAFVQDVSPVTTSAPFIGVVTQTPGVVSGANFENSSEEEQRQFVQNLRNINHQRKRPVVFVIKGRVLKELFEENPFARVLWLQEILSNEANTVVLLHKTGENFRGWIRRDVAAKIRTTSEDNLEIVIAEEAQKRDNLVAAFDPEYPDLQKRGNVLRFRSVIVAALARSLLESLAGSVSAYTSEKLTSIANLFHQVYIQQGLVKKAA